LVSFVFQLNTQHTLAHDVELIQVLQNLQKRSIAFAIPVWNGFQSEGLDPGQGDFQVKNNQSRLGDACVPVMCV
jgi:hypothetical protein